MTKQYFKEILFQALDQAKGEYELSSDIKLNESIYLQLVDIKDKVVDKRLKFTETQAYDKYSLGVLAIRNFGGEEGNDYPKKLSDIAWGISFYSTMAED